MTSSGFLFYHTESKAPITVRAGAKQSRWALHSPPLIDFCFIGGILPRPPAVATERWQRAHGVSQDGGRSGHISDAVQFLVLLSQAGRLTLSSLWGCHARAAPIQAAPVLGLHEAHCRREGKGCVAAQGRVPLQGDGVICGRTGTGDITSRLLLLRLLRRETKIKMKVKLREYS